MSKKEDIPQPPQPPDVEKRLYLKPLQWIGIPLMMLLPILAVVGVFGYSSDQQQAASDELLVNVEYVTRFRYKMIGQVTVKVENLTAAAMPTVTVSFDAGYIDPFSNVTFNPSLQEMTADAYIVELSELAPGETQTVEVELQAEESLRHEGMIAVAAPGAEPVSVEVTTWVFP